MPGFDSIIFITHDLDLALTYANVSSSSLTAGLSLTARRRTS
jgi:hypothetical protein